MRSDRRRAGRHQDRSNSNGDGFGSIKRACGIAVQAKIGDLVCQGDVIETAVDGRVGIRFIDGTAFNLSGGARWRSTNSSATPTGPRIRRCSVSPEGPSLSLSARWLRPVALGSARLLEAFRAAHGPAGSACCRSPR